MEIRNFHYINERTIDADYSQALGVLITEISVGKNKELQYGAEGELSLGSIMQLLGLKLGIKGNITNKKIDEEEVKQQLTAANKVLIVEGILKRQHKLIELSLDNTDEQELAKSLNPGFYLLNGTFNITKDHKEDRQYVLFSKPLQSHLFLIPASVQYMGTMRGLDYVRKVNLSTFCYYGGSVTSDENYNDSYAPGTPPTTHVFYPRAIWDYGGITNPYFLNTS